MNPAWIMPATIVVDSAIGRMVTEVAKYSRHSENA
jgi:hypothetical protein